VYPSAPEHSITIFCTAQFIVYIVVSRLLSAWEIRYARECPGVPGTSQASLPTRRDATHHATADVPYLLFDTVKGGAAWRATGRRPSYRPS
jgi:hypothetical protein